MRMVRLIICGFGLWLVCGAGLAGAVSASGGEDRCATGWMLPSIGPGRGTWDASVGAFLWSDEARLRNLQVRADLDLAPGVRVHGVLRSNRDLNGLEGVHPHLDEGYLEGYAGYREGSSSFSGSLRIGSVRYLRFPYPDDIAIFDQVPGVSDLTGGARTGYAGELLVLDYAHKSGFGAHFTGISWGFGRSGGTETIEGYLSDACDLGSLHFEGRLGRLARRPEPLGTGALGHDLFLGMHAKGWAAGLLYEKLHQQPAYTGVMLEFRPSRLNRALGRIAFDYDRHPEGLSAQIPLASGTIGRLRRTAPQGGVLVGEIRAVRIRTYWQNGQVRNFYEHRISAWGQTSGPGIVALMTEEPWYLQAEALVSPHSSFRSRDDLRDWERDRQGPAQVAQKVTYSFYRAPSSPAE